MNREVVYSRSRVDCLVAEVLHAQRLYLWTLPPSLFPTTVKQQSGKYCCHLNIYCSGGSQQVQGSVLLYVHRNRKAH